MVTTKQMPHDSDDDFDLIPDADAVSDISDEDATNHRQASMNHDTGAGRLAGPHEVPQMPFSSDFDAGFASIDQKLSDHAVEDFQGDGKAAKGNGNFINSGLEYTKSVYNKLRNKDALIAVMGYATLLRAAQAFLGYSRCADPLVG